MKTSSGATAVQIVWSFRRGSRKIEHIGSAHDDADLEALTAARHRLAAADRARPRAGRPGAVRAAGNRLRPDGAPVGRPVPPMTRSGSRRPPAMTRYSGSSFWRGSSSPLTSKQDSLRVLEEASVASASYPTLNRRLPAWAEEPWQQGLSEACAAHARLGPASLVLYDVSTIYFEADHGDGFREPGFSGLNNKS